MRKAFIDGLCEVAQKNPRVMLITGDLGYRFLEKFSERFPDQFLNIGVSEADMVSVAAGLATCGYIPFIYSIASFASMRAFEQIRDDICLQNLNVKIVAIGAGLAYTKAGPTHHSYEDIALMRMLPNMTIINPVDPPETRNVIAQVVRDNGPTYIRLERNPEKDFHKNPPDFRIGSGYLVSPGKDGIILTTGTKIEYAMTISKRLQKKNIRLGIAAFPTIVPLDEHLLQSLANRYHQWITLEEHSINGGFGTAILEWANEKDLIGKIQIHRLGLTAKTETKSGDYDYLLSQNSLTVLQITAKIFHWLHHG
jgi:transketolase